MTPKLTLIMTPDKLGTSVCITLFATVPDHTGRDRHVPLYNAARRAEPMYEGQSIEQWAHDAVRDHSEGILGTLGSLIAQGAITMMATFSEPQKSLRVNAWPASLRPARMSPVGASACAPAGFRLWVPPC